MELYAERCALEMGELNVGVFGSPVIQEDTEFTGDNADGFVLTIGLFLFKITFVFLW